VAGIAPGTYNVTFAKSGYVSQTLSVTITSASTTTKAVAMTETPAASLVFRFYNKRNGSHFYTASEDEKSRVQADLSSIYTFEGVAYTVNNRSTLNASPLYRFYNKSNGSHFYTASLAEKTRVQADLSATYSYDGPAYNVCPTPSDTTVWRFFNKKNGSHFYTASPTEKDNVIKNLGTIYSLDGPGFYIAP
jgi:serralysin